MLARVALVLALSLASCGNEPEPPPGAAGTPVLSIGVDGGTVMLEVEIADEPAERARGLMGRTSLPEDRGMVFLFERRTTSGFWMKDTLIPLSIAFWDEDELIVAIVDMTPCEGDPCPTYRPGVPYVGAVEVNRGWFERSGVAIGDRVELRA